MIDLISKDELRELMEKQDGYCVTIYLPTHRAGADIEQDPIRLKNLLRTTGTQLRDMGLRSPQAEDMLEPASALLTDRLFWENQADGLAIYLAQGFSRTFRLPIRFETFQLVSRRFHMKPVMPLMTGDGKFYLLAISQKQVKFLQGLRDTIQEVDLENVPQGLAEALRFDDPERQLQFYSRETGIKAPGDHAAGFHGHGAGVDDRKEAISRYFNIVDKGLNEFLRDYHEPLVLVCVDYLAPIYREVNSYPHLVESFVPGNPDEISAKELHARSWQIVEPIFQQDQADAFQKFNELGHTDRTSTDLKEILQAAYFGRVEILFVGLGQQHWGRFYPDENVLHVHPELQPDDEDLLDSAAVYTFMNGGTVYAVEADTLPGGGSIAAIFRY
jgi:hypothetical protein